MNNDSTVIKTEINRLPDFYLSMSKNNAELFVTPIRRTAVLFRFYFIGLPSASYHAFMEKSGAILKRPWNSRD